TAGRWPWKSESAKECVTTHLPNELALKMDGAQAREGREEVMGVNLDGTAFSADLGDSSKYSNENFED
ncbi:17423_t:CDS:2, partial [Gigaspora margarita]